MEAIVFDTVVRHGVARLPHTQPGSLNFKAQRRLPLNRSGSLLSSK